MIIELRSKTISHCAFVEYECFVARGSRFQDLADCAFTGRSPYVLHCISIMQKKSSTPQYYHHSLKASTCTLQQPYTNSVANLLGY